MFATKRALLRVLEREREAFATERARLIDQICNLAGRPWTPPPERASFDIPELPDYVSAPEQEPEY